MLIVHFQYHSSIQISVSRVEPDVLNKQILYFGKDESEHADDQRYRILWPEASNDGPSLSSIDKPSGVLRVWCSLIESLSFTCIIAVERYQSQAIDTLFIILQDLLVIPGW